MEAAPVIQFDTETDRGSGAAPTLVAVGVAAPVIQFDTETDRGSGAAPTLYFYIFSPDPLCGRDAIVFSPDPLCGLDVI